MTHPKDLQLHSRLNYEPFWKSIMNKKTHPFENINDLLYRFAQKARDVFWIKSPDYKKQIYISKAFENVWGRSCQSLYEFPEKWEDYLYLEDRDRLKRSIRKRNEDIEPNEKFFEWDYIVIMGFGSCKYH